MNKKELLQKADELIAKANELKELANKEDVILVPDNIKITKGSTLGQEGYGMGIINGKQELCYKNTGIWIVTSTGYTHEIKCKLTPCKYEDLKPGDVFYRDDNDNPNFDDLIRYAIKLEEGYQFWDGGDCYNYNYNIIFDYHWKVEEV